MKAKKLFLCLVVLISQLKVIAQIPCNLGEVRPTDTTICIGSSVRLSGIPTSFQNCGLTKIQQAGI